MERLEQKGISGEMIEEETELIFYENDIFLE